MKVVMLARMAAWPAVVVIVVLSVVPGSVRPHVLGNDRAEHFIAYLVAGSLFVRIMSVPDQTRLVVLFDGK